MSFYRNMSIELLGDRKQAMVLRLLYRNQQHRFSQKEISDVLNIHPSTISRVCKKLEKFNVICRYTVGKNILYHLDMDSFITQKIIIPVFRNEEKFFEDLAIEIIDKMDSKIINDISSIYLFGSIVQNEDLPSSDIDLGIILKHVDITGIRTAEIKEVIERDILALATHLKLHLDVHIFTSGEKRRKQGLTLNDICEQGTVIWKGEK